MNLKLQGSIALGALETAGETTLPLDGVRPKNEPALSEVKSAGEVMI